MLKKQVPWPKHLKCRKIVCLHIYVYWMTAWKLYSFGGQKPNGWSVTMSYRQAASSFTVAFVYSKSHWAVAFHFKITNRRYCSHSGLDRNFSRDSIFKSEVPYMGSWTQDWDSLVKTHTVPCHRIHVSTHASSFYIHTATTNGHQPREDEAQRADFWFYSAADDWSDGKMLPLPGRVMQMWPLSCCIDYSLHLLCVFGAIFSFFPFIVNCSLCCVLVFPSMLRLFPWVTQNSSPGQAQSIITDRPLVYVFLINNWAIVSPVKHDGELTIHCWSYI